MSSTIEVRAPSEQSEGTRSQVQRWLKAIGDSVVENEPLLEVETDKVTIEIPAPANGTLNEILKQEQEEIQPGDLLARIVPVAAAGSSTDAPSATRGRTAALSQDTAENSVAAQPRQARVVESATDRSRQASPAVRRLLQQRGLDVSAVNGTGEGGRVTVDDVLAHSAAATPTPTRAQAAGEGSAQTKNLAELRTTSVPHSTMRKRIAERMVDSLLHTAPHVTTIFEVDMSAVLAHRAKQRDDFDKSGISLTLTAYFLMACAQAIREVPEVNSRWTADALEMHGAMNIGVATALETKGLIVPVVRDVQALDLRGIAKRLGELVARAREDKLSAADVQGGTFTISNHGVSGSLVAAPIIINQPQSAILGVGRLEKRAVVVTENGEDRIVVRPRCYVTLTIDHRVMDGHRANRFLQVLTHTLENWAA